MSAAVTLGKPAVAAASDQEAQKPEEEKKVGGDKPEWVYHVTTTEAAVIIKREGMQSRFMKDGELSARPDGAFVKDRIAKEPGKRIEKLALMLKNLRSHECGLAQIEAYNPNYTRLTYQAVGDGDEDHPKVAELMADRTGAYKAGLPSHSVSFSAPRSPSPTSASSSPAPRAPMPAGPALTNDQLRADASQMILQSPNHFLCQLAVQLVEIEYRSEEILCAKGIYFLKSEYALGGYNDYLRTHASREIMVFRVKKSGVTGLEIDWSEYRAWRTEHKVPSDQIEFILDPIRFPEASYRDSAESWRPLTQWSRS